MMHLLMQRRRGLTMVLILACSTFAGLLCRPAQVLAAQRTAASHSQAPPPQFRLPLFAVPLRYQVKLTLTPDKDTFAGALDIQLRFKEASPVLWLNAEKLKVKNATLTVGGQTLSAGVVPQPKDLVGFTFGRPVGPGAAKIHVEYEGQVSRKDMEGIFQVKDGGHWYIYSQFESILARQAFPCFDEPSYKVPWQLRLNVPKEDTAFSNTPVVSETEGSDGRKTVEFRETRPLPSYLVAIAVGPLDIVEARHAGAKNTAIRIIVPRGRGPEAEYVAAATPDIVNLLEKYFGIPYPYEKLDQAAIPVAGYAMEHPGLVTYGAGSFLMKPGETTLEKKRLVTSVMAHELAHQWFGDLVTTAWWDDIWLNEGFASWMANKIVNQYRPEWKMNIAELNSYQGAMGTDGLVSSRKVRQPILSDDDVANAFDGITYSKGSALLNMFESYLGAPRFQEGIRRYLQKYAWGSATSAEFLDALGGGNASIEQAFSTFLDQAGVPLVTVQLNCGGSAKLQLSQQRFLPRGSRGSLDQTWGIPVCVRYHSGEGDARECTLLTKKTEVMTLGRARGCPDWIYANAGEAGYYRVLYGDGLLGSLLKGDKTLTLPERVGLIGDIGALTQGYLPTGEAMTLVPKFARDPSREVVTKTLSIVGDLDDRLVPEDLKPKYRRYIADLYEKRAEQLGWKSKPGDDDDSRLLRSSLLPVVANQAEDSELIAEAHRLALAWVEDHKALDQDIVSAVLNTAARHSDRALFDRLRSQAHKETGEDLRGTLLGALGSFRDPAILGTALSILLTDEFDSRESLTILFAAAGSPETRGPAFNFVRQNWDALVGRLPSEAGFESAAVLPFVAGDYCDDQHRAEVEAFFKGRSTRYAGGPRILDQVLEGISLCAASKSANQASVAEFLRKYSLMLGHSKPFRLADQSNSNPN
jgi:cytosol alanyl aminopeptidase